MEDSNQLTKRIMVGSLLGCLVGLIIGHYASSMNFIGTIYTNLLIVVVFPYLICSLLHSLGSLSAQLTRHLLRSGIVIYLLLMVAVFIVLGIVSLLFPSPKELLYVAAPQDSNLITQLIDIIIPSNLVQDITANYVPAIILFCILFGLVLQKVEKKAPLMSVLDSIVKACLYFWEAIIYFTPLAAFVFFANITGTLSFSELQYTSVYLSIVVVTCLLLGFWLLPFLLMSLTGITGKRIVDDTKQAVIISVMTGMIATVLPLLIKAVEAYIQERKFADSKTEELIEVSATVAYPFVQLGNYTTYLFMIYAAYFYGVEIPLVKQLLLPLLSMLSFIGSNSAVFLSYKMLASWLHLPVHSIDLLTELNAITRYAASFLSIIGLYSFLMLILFSYYRKIQWCWGRLLKQLLLFFSFLTTVILAILVNTTLSFIIMLAACGVILVLLLRRKQLPNNTRRYFTGFFMVFVMLLVITFQLVDRFPNPTAEDKYSSLTLSKDDKVVVVKSLSQQKIMANRPILKSILDKNLLVFGYIPDTPPFSYLNKEGELVGLAIEYGYLLAKSLSVGIEFTPVSKHELIKRIADGSIDISYGVEVFGGESTMHFLYSTPSHYSFLVFVTATKNKQLFAESFAHLRKQELNLGVIAPNYKLQLLKGYFSRSQLTDFEDSSQAKKALDNKKVEAIVMPIDNAMAFVNHYAGFLTVVPTGKKIELPVAFIMSRKATMLNQLTNHWLATAKHSGLAEQLYNYWVMGSGGESPPPRWNIIDWLRVKSVNNLKSHL